MVAPNPSMLSPPTDGSGSPAMLRPVPPFCPAMFRSPPDPVPPAPPPMTWFCAAPEPEPPAPPLPEQWEPNDVVVPLPPVPPTAPAAAPPEPIADAWIVFREYPPPPPPPPAAAWLAPVVPAPPDPPPPPWTSTTTYFTFVVFVHVPLPVKTSTFGGGL